MSDRLELLVIGGGPAGLSTARAYREAFGAGAVAIVADEPRTPYNRPPLTKELLRAEITEDELPLEDEPWFSEQQIRLVSGRAVALNPGEHEVSLSGGRQLGYDTCVLATGAEPKRLPIPGADDPAVRTLRSLDDLRELQRRLRPGAETVVIGSGFIGCEIAASLRALGHPVTLVSDEPAPNQRRLGAQAAAEIRGWLEQAGVDLVLGAEVQSIQRRGGRLEVRTEGRRVGGTLAIMATGVAPRAELALAAGLELDGGAVPTDSRMRTATADLLAAGDVCVAENGRAGRRLHVEHWGDALGQGAVAGRTAAGGDTGWEDVPGFWSSIAGHTMKYAAWGDGYDQSRFEPLGDGAFAAWYGHEGRLVGVLAHAADDAYERGQALIEGGAPWS